MVPRRPSDPTDAESSSGGLREGDEHVSAESAVHSDAALESNEDYHTAESDISDLANATEDRRLDALNDGEEEEMEDASPGPAAPRNPPLLPPELLKPHLDVLSHTRTRLPLGRMTRGQKRTARNVSRRAKKRMYERLRQSSEGTGVLEAGVAAQEKRGMVVASLSQREGEGKVRSGRVGKKKMSNGRPEVSGRQSLVERRRRDVEVSKEGLVKKDKKKGSGRRMG